MLAQALLRVFQLEKYTDLNAPLEETNDYVQYITHQIEQKLSSAFSFPDEYIQMMTCFDGGSLFGTLIYPLDSRHGENCDYDLLSVNDSLWHHEDLPRTYVAIAMLDYGDLIVVNCADQNPTLQIWDPSSKEIVGRWKNVHSWLDEECDIAIRLISDGLLEAINE